jgi:hypothetical protein
MKRFLIRLALYIAAVLLIGNLISFGLLLSLKKSEFYKPYLLNSLNKEEQLDYIILGSSRGLTSISSMQIDSSLNTTGINLSMDDTDLKSHVLMLNHFFQSGYKAKYCVLTLDEGNFTATNKKLGNNDYRFIGYSNKDYVIDHYNNYETGKVKPLSLSRYFPLASYSYYNLELALPSALATVKPKYHNKFDQRGNFSYPNTGGLKTMKPSVTIEVNIVNPLLQEVSSLCGKYGAQLIVYIAPYSNENITVSNGNDYKIINHSNLLPESPQLFYDHIHVNKKGRKEASTAFSKDFEKILNLDLSN